MTVRGENVGQGRQGVLGWSLCDEVTSEQGPGEVTQQTRPISGEEEHFRQRAQ